MIGRVLLPVGQERLEKRIEPEPMSGCWLWMGASNPGAYGIAQRRLAHRVVYELLRGPIPPGLTLDHLCRVHRCVNPAHLEPVSWRTNILRGVGIAAQRARQTHCIHGHPFDESNTYFRDSRLRGCRACLTEKTRARAQRVFLASDMRLCLCGCGREVPRLKRNTQPREGWIKGHHRRKARA